MINKIEILYTANFEARFQGYTIIYCYDSIPEILNRLAQDIYNSTPEMMDKVEYHD